MAASTYDNVSPANRRLREAAEERRTEYNEQRRNDRVSSGNRGPIDRNNPRQRNQPQTTEEAGFETSEPKREGPNPGRYNNAIGERLKAKNKVAAREQAQARRFRQRQEKLGKVERSGEGELKEALEKSPTKKEDRMAENKETQAETTETETSETTQPAVEAQPETTEEPAAVEAENQVEAKERAKAYKNASNDDAMKSAFGK